MQLLKATSVALFLLAIVTTFANVAAMCLKPAPACPTATTNTVSPSRQETISGVSRWADNFGYTDDGLVMSQSGIETYQWLTTYSLSSTTTSVAEVRQWPNQIQPQVGMTASAVVSSDESVRKHVYWPGAIPGSSMPANTRVDVVQMNPSGTIAGWSYANAVASGYRVANARAATCGAAGYTKDLSIRAFGSHYGTDIAPIMSPTPSPYIDWYYIGTNSFYSSTMTSIAGGSSVTLRESPNALSAGTLCIWAGGITTTGFGFSNEVSILNVASGTSSMSWSVGTLCVARAYMGAAYISSSVVGSAKAIFAGGYYPSPLAPGTNIPSSAVDIFDIATMTSSQSCLPSGPRFLLAGTTVGDRYAIFIGGYTGPTTMTNVVDIFDALTGTWLTLAGGAMSVARGSPAVGSLMYPTPGGPLVPNAAYFNPGRFSVVIASGATSGGPSNRLDQMTSFFNFASGSMPWILYGAGYASWPSTNVSSSNTLNGAMILANGVSLYGTLSNYVFVLNAGLDPTISSNWAMTLLSSSQPDDVRQYSHATIYYDGSINNYVGLIWGGKNVVGNPITRFDQATKSTPITWTAGSYAVTQTDDSGGHCFTGTFLNPTVMNFVRAFGQTGSGVPTSAFLIQTPSYMSYFIKGTLPRFSGDAVSAGRLVVFAGGTTGSSLTNLIDVYDCDPYGGSAPPTGMTLSVARYRMLTAFLPRTNVGSVTGYNGYIFFAGGQVASGAVTNVIDIINNAVLPWTISSTLTLTVARRSGVGIGIGTRYVVFAGGVDGTGALSNVVDLFDVTTWSIIAIKPLSVARSELAIGLMLIDASTQTYKVVCAGGYTSAGTATNVVDTIMIPQAGAVW
jgi:hypothetical protein